MWSNTTAGTLYTDLMTLCSETDAFYYVDHIYDGHLYRIFNYRLASYTDFLKPGAMECRGHTFLINGDSSVLVSAVMEKFFNVNENPMTMDLDWTRVVRVDDKRDGSLISTVRTPTGWILKSKGSLSSEQARAATAWLDRNPAFRDAIDALVVAGYTVNMEWTAPDNQIVLGYDRSELRILNARDMETGDYLSIDSLDSNWIVDTVDFGDEMSGQWIDHARTLTGIEGFVLWFADGMKVKLKTDWYSNLHLQKEQVTNPRRLFESVLMEQSDDLKTLFLEDPQSIQRIEEMEVKAKTLYNRLHKLVDNFYQANKHLSRKDYAILGQQVLKADGVFSQAMNLYLEKDMGLREHLIKNYKSFGIVDTSVNE